VAFVWIGFYFLHKDNRVYSSGRLNAAHAVLEKQCAACHVQQAGGFSASAADAACLACHDGPAHHPEATASTAPKQACAECHVEHRGKMSLNAVATRACANCHAELGTMGPSSHFARNIKSFADGHPEFAALRPIAGKGGADSGTIKLNHALHMKLIRRGPTGPMVQLECGDCHKAGDAKQRNWRYGDSAYAPFEQHAPLQLQRSQDFAEEFLAPQSAGFVTARPASDRARMTAPKFENACADCHQLTFDKRFDEGVPHDTPAVIHEYLVKRFAQYIATHASELREMQTPERTLAGRNAQPAQRSLTGSEWVAERVTVSEELLWHKTCAQCHGISGSSLADVGVARWDEQKDSKVKGFEVSMAGIYAQIKAGSLPKVAAANMTLQWMPHARFDHDAHRGFSCEGCHSKALSSTEASDILVPGITTCQKCHAAGAEHAEAGCFECHTYHDWAKRKEVKPTFTLPGLAEDTKERNR
jgi:hypothetical protein